MILMSKIVLLRSSMPSIDKFFYLHKILLVINSLYFVHLKHYR